MSPRHFTKFLYGPYFIEDHVKDSPKNKHKMSNFFSVKIKKAKKRFGNNK